MTGNSTTINTVVAIYNLTIDGGASTISVSPTSNGIYAAGTITITDSGDTLALGTLSFNSSSTAAISNAGTISTSTANIYCGDFTSTDTFMATGTNIITASGNVEVSDTFTHNSTTTISMSGTSKTINVDSITIYNLTITDGSVSISTNNLTCTGNFLLSGGEFNGGSYTLDVSGDWTNNGGTFTPGSGTVVFNSTLYNQAINGSATTQTFNNITENKSGKTLSIGGSTTTLTLNGSITITAGTFTAPTILNIAGDFTNNDTFTHNSGTIVFNGSSAQAINGSSNTTFYNLSLSTAQERTIADGRTITVNGTLNWTYGDLSVGSSAEATLTLAGSITIPATYTLFMISTSDIYVGGDWTNSGIFSPDDGTVTFNGNVDQTIDSGGTGSGKVFNNLTVNQSESTKTVTVTDSLQVDGTLTVTEGTFQIIDGGLDLNTNGSVSIASDGIFTLSTTSVGSITWTVGVGTAVTNNGLLNITGISGYLVYLRSSSSNYWYLNDNTTSDTSNPYITYTDYQYSDASGGNTIYPDSLTCICTEPNVNWTLAYTFPYEINMANQSGWTTGGTGTGQLEWERGVPNVPGLTSDHTRGSSEVNCWGTDLDGTYDPDTDQWLKSPPITIPLDIQPPVLSVWHWYNIGDGDLGVIQISTNNQTWNQIQSVYGDSNGWVISRHSLDTIADYRGKTIYLRFKLNAPPGSECGYGWYIDDFKIGYGLRLCETHTYGLGTGSSDGEYLRLYYDGPGINIAGFSVVSSSDTYPLSGTMGSGGTYLNIYSCSEENWYADSSDYIILQDAVGRNIDFMYYGASYYSQKPVNLQWTGSFPDNPGYGQFLLRSIYVDTTDTRYADTDDATDFLESWMDFDVDELLNKDENINITDPYYADTDFDGLTDGQEVNGIDEDNDAESSPGTSEYPLGFEQCVALDETGYLTFWDPYTNWSYDSALGDDFTTLAYGDVNGDGIDEAVCSVVNESVNHFAVFDVHTGDCESSFSGEYEDPSGWIDIACGDFDGNGDDEVAGLGNNNTLYYWDPVGSWGTTATDNLADKTHIAAGDVDDDYVDEIIITFGDPNDHIIAFNILEDEYDEIYCTDDISGVSCWLDVACGNFLGGGDIVAGLADHTTEVNIVIFFDEYGDEIGAYSMLTGWYKLSSGDINGDGTEDVIGLLVVSNDIYVQAFDVETYESLWGEWGFKITTENDWLDLAGGAFGNFLIDAGDDQNDAYCNVPTFITDATVDETPCSGFITWTWYIEELDITLKDEFLTYVFTEPGTYHVTANAGNGYVGGTDTKTITVSDLTTDPLDADSDDDDIMDGAEYYGIDIIDDASFVFPGTSETVQSLASYWTGMGHSDYIRDNPNNYITSPKTYDTDGDTLHDDFELERGNTVTNPGGYLNPSDIDTDGDGFTDYNEILYRTDPTDPAGFMMFREDLSTGEIDYGGADWLSGYSLDDKFVGTELCFELKIPQDTYTSSYPRTLYTLQVFFKALTTDSVSDDISITWCSIYNQFPQWDNLEGVTIIHDYYHDCRTSLCDFRDGFGVKSGDYLIYISPTSGSDEIWISAFRPTSYYVDKKFYQEHNNETIQSFYPSVLRDSAMKQSEEEEDVRGIIDGYKDIIVPVPCAQLVYSWSRDLVIYSHDYLGQTVTFDSSLFIEEDCIPGLIPNVNVSHLDHEGIMKRYTVGIRMNPGRDVYPMTYSAWLHHMQYAKFSPLENPIKDDYVTKTYVDIYDTDDLPYQQEETPDIQGFALTLIGFIPIIGIGANIVAMILGACQIWDALQDKSDDDYKIIPEDELPNAGDNYVGFVNLDEVIYNCDELQGEDILLSSHIIFGVEQWGNIVTKPTWTQAYYNCWPSFNCQYGRTEYNYYGANLGYDPESDAISTLGSSDWDDDGTSGLPNHFIPGIGV
jgi:hypothetical protein